LRIEICKLHRITACPENGQAVLFAILPIFAQTTISQYEIFLSIHADIFLGQENDFFVSP